MSTQDVAVDVKVGEHIQWHVFGVTLHGDTIISTLVAIGFGFLIQPDGLGVFVGLAVFQVLMLVGAAVPVFRSLRPTS